MNKDRDQLAKGILEELLDDAGEGQREKEVDPSYLQRMDLLFRPLGLLFLLPNQETHSYVKAEPTRWSTL